MSDIQQLETTVAPPAVVQRLAYRPRATQIVLGLIFFGASGLFFTWWAMNGRGLVLNGILQLGPTGAARFKWACAAASLAMCMFALLFLVPQSLRSGRQIVLESDAIRVPAWHGWSAASVLIRPAEITRIRVLRYEKATFVRLHHPGGVARINSRHLDRNEQIDVILRWMGDRRPDLMAG